MKMWTAMAVVCVLASGAWGDDLPRIASLKSGIEPANLSGKIEERPSGGSIHTGGSGSDSVVEEKKRTKSDPVPQGGYGDSTATSNVAKVVEAVTGAEPSVLNRAGGGDTPPAERKMNALLFAQSFMDSIYSVDEQRFKDLKAALVGVVFDYSDELLVQAAVGSLFHACAHKGAVLDAYTWMILQDVYPDAFGGALQRENLDVYEKLGDFFARE